MYLLATNLKLTFPLRCVQLQCCNLILISGHFIEFRAMREHFLINSSFIPMLVNKRLFIRKGRRKKIMEKS